MQPSQAPRRKPFVIRYSALIAWTFWVVSAVLTVVATADRAPRSTVPDWVNLVATWIGVTIIPLLVILIDHGHKMEGHRHPLRFLLYGLVILTFVLFGLMAADWTAAMPGANLHDAWDKFGAALFFAMLPAIGLGMVAAHLEHLRETEKSADRETAGESE